MPVRDNNQPDNRQGSGSSGNSWMSQDTVRNSEGQLRDQPKASSGGGNADSFPGSLNVNPKYAPISYNYLLTMGCLMARHFLIIE